MRNIDIGHYKALFGVTPEQLAQDMPVNGKREQVPSLGGELWQPSPINNNTFLFMPVQLGGVQLWNPIMRIVGRKTIVETQLVERRGSVKEIISTDDYIINIRGIIKGEDGQWPDAELEQLVQLYERNEAIPIESALTNVVLNGNEYVVITNLQLPGRQGMTDVMPYELELVVDIPFELELDENGNESTQ